jgi:hypothetical protein
MLSILAYENIQEQRYTRCEFRWLKLLGLGAIVGASSTETLK